HQGDQRALARSARPDQGEDFAGFGFQIDAVQNLALEAFRLVAETDVLEGDLFGERRQSHGAGPLAHFVRGIHEAEYFRRRADRPLEAVVEEGELADRIVELEDGNDENDEVTAGHAAVDNLFPPQPQQQRDGDGAENVHQGRADRGGGDRAQIRTKQALRRLAEAGEFPVLHAESFYDAVAGDGLVQDVLDFRQFVLAAAGGVAHPAPDFRGGNDDEGDKQQQQPRQLLALENDHAHGEQEGEELLQEFGQDVRHRKLHAL